jgi:DNA-binding LacI/PurR family transcriptional regulator
MKSGKSRIIGLVVAYLENYFYPEMVERLSVELQKVGYHVLIFLAPVSVDNVDKVSRKFWIIRLMASSSPRSRSSSDLAARCQSTGIPVVLFNRGHADKNLCSVTSDNYAGGKALADYLCSLGHRRIAYIAGFSGATTQIDREAGFRAGLAEAGKDLLRPRRRQFRLPHRPGCRA